MGFGQYLTRNPDSIRSASAVRFRTTELNNLFFLTIQLGLKIFICKSFAIQL